MFVFKLDKNKDVLSLSFFLHLSAGCNYCVRFFPGLLIQCMWKKYRLFDTGINATPVPNWSPGYLISICTRFMCCMAAIVRFHLMHIKVVTCFTHLKETAVI